VKTKTKNMRKKTRKYNSKIEQIRKKNNKNKKKETI